MISEKMGNVPPVYDTSYSDGQRIKTADNSKLKQLLKNKNYNFEFTDLKTGISETIDWFLQNYNTLRGKL